MQTQKLASLGQLTAFFCRQIASARRKDASSIKRPSSACSTVYRSRTAIAIENTRLLNELRQRTDDLSKSQPLEPLRFWPSPRAVLDRCRSMCAGKYAQLRNDRSHSETAGNPLADNRSNFAFFSECGLISKEKWSDLKAGAFFNLSLFRRAAQYRPPVPERTARSASGLTPKPQGRPPCCGGYCPSGGASPTTE